jgi:D-alanyl-D-alanine carboxypeptidase
MTSTLAGPQRESLAKKASYEKFRSVKRFLDPKPQEPKPLPLPQPQLIIRAKTVKKPAVPSSEDHNAVIKVPRNNFRLAWKKPKLEPRLLDLKDRPPLQLQDRKKLGSYRKNISSQQHCGISIASTLPSERLALEALPCTAAPEAPGSALPDGGCKLAAGSPAQPVPAAPEQQAPAGDTGQPQLPQLGEQNAPKSGKKKQQKIKKYLSLFQPEDRLPESFDPIELIQQVPKVTAKSWVGWAQQIAFDASQNRPLFGYKIMAKREMASLTKMMTLFTTLETVRHYNIDMDSTECLVSRYAGSMIGTSAGLKAGDRLKLGDLLFGTRGSPGLMLPSGNDAAQAISEAVGKLLAQDVVLEAEAAPGGSSERQPAKKKESYSRYFVRRMNSLAASLGMSSTSFANPHGLVNRNNHSCCLDLSLLFSHAAAKCSGFLRVVGTQTHTATIVREGAELSVTWRNTHKCFDDERFVGGKTGITPPAGPCLASALRLANAPLLVVILLNSRPA